MTEEYILQHRSIRDCLVKGVLNYSAFARAFIEDKGMNGVVEQGAVVVAVRRLKDRMRSEKAREDSVLALIRASNVDIKNNVVIFTVSHMAPSGTLIGIETTLRTSGGLYYAIDGTCTVTLIVQSQHDGYVQERLGDLVQDRKADCSLITFTSPGIDTTPGVISHLTSLFYQLDVNIEEFMSCSDDTLIVIDSADVGTMIRHLGFRRRE